MSTPSQDVEHLRLLSILYYVWGGLGLMFSCIGGVYVLGMSGLLVAVGLGHGGPPPWLGGVVALLGGFALVLAVALGGLSLFAAKSLADRRNYTLCIVVGALTCLSFPFGTALGVFALVVLSRPTVKAMFSPPSGVA